MHKVVFLFLGVAICGFVAAESSAPQPVRFRNAAPALGLAESGVNSTGPAFADYDNDGDVDIYVTVEAHQDGHANRLWENDGEGGYTDVAGERGVANGNGLARGASWGDIDNDGDVDLVVANMPSSAGPVREPMTVYKNLLIETGEPRFENISVAAGFLRQGNEKDAQVGGISDTGAGVAWADYDNDGYLDLYVKLPDYDVKNVMFHNNGDGTFSDVTQTTGTGVVGALRTANAQGSPSWTDIDQDGWVDLLVTIEGDRNLLFLNQRDGTFIDITRSRKPPSGLAFLNPGNANGACVGDIDNDGDMDFYLPTADQANRVILSQLAETGKVKFKDITLTSGAGDMGGARGCAMADFNNDGWLDIYVNNGGASNVLINDVIAMMPVFVQFYIAFEPAYNKLFLNNGDLTFTDATDGSGAEGFGIGSGVGAADVDDDGFADLFVTNRTYYNMGQRIGEPDENELLLNKGNDNNWVRVQLIGTAGNRDAYGARVKLVSGDLEQYREQTSAHGYNSTNDPRMLFGLGARSDIDFIEVTWPGGAVSKVVDAAPGGTVIIQE
jgi:hypothetical protein